MFDIVYIALAYPFDIMDYGDYDQYRPGLCDQGVFPL